MIPTAEPYLALGEVRDRAVDLLRTLGIASDVWRDLSARTIRYYRQKRIIQEPAGLTSKARYARHHVLQVAIARLSGHMAQTTLEEAAQLTRKPYEHLCQSLDELVALYHRSLEVRRAAKPEVEVRPLQPAPERQPSPRYRAIDLGAGAHVLIPADHPVVARQPAEVIRDSLREALDRIITL